jgi:phosphoacetylglucosamine mutase
MANQTSPEAVLKYYQRIAEEQKIDLSKPANVVVARDTRASGSRLLGCLLDGLKAAGAEAKDYGFLTTPQLHYMVRCLNTEGTSEAYGVPTEVGYYEKFSSAYKRAMGNKKTNGGLTVDCANGVGGPKLNELIKYLPVKETGPEISVVNDNVIKPEALNVDVGLITAFHCCYRLLIIGLVRSGLCQDQPARPSFVKDRARRPMLLTRR